MKYSIAYRSIGQWAWTSDDWWYCHESQMNNYTLYFAESYTRATAEQLHGHWKKKQRLLERKSVHCLNMNIGVENIVKPCATCLEYQQTQLQERVLHYEIPCRPREVVRADIFMFNNKMLLYTIGYYGKFHIMKKVSSLVADDLVQMVILIYSEYGLPKSMKRSFQMQAQI